jgi:FkbM family methyltransferase
MNAKISPSDRRWGGILAFFPPFPGKARIIETAALLTRLSGANEDTVCLWRGAPFSVDLRDRIQREMWAGCYEPHVMRALRVILRPGDTFVDVGAHIGYLSYLAAGLVEPQGAVFSFEPDPAAFARLKRNLEVFPWAHPLNLAASDEEGQVGFERSPVSSESGWGTLSQVRDMRRGQHVTVTARSLDSWSSSADLSGLRLIKLDAEGSEPRVLLGARKLLQRFRPVVLMELNGILLRQTGSSAIALQKLLRNEQYAMFRLGLGKLCQIPVPREFDLMDSMALPEESLQETLGRFRQCGFRAVTAHGSNGHF